jgi:hypothetical protein
MRKKTENVTEIDRWTPLNTSCRSPSPRRRHGHQYRTELKKITREEGESWRRKQGHWKGVSGSIGALPRTLSAMGMALEAPSPCCAARRGLRTPGWRPAAACRLSRECVCARKEKEGRDGEEKRGGWCGVLNPDGALSLAHAGLAKLIHDY